MAMTYWPTREEDKPRLDILQLEILIFYFRNQDDRYSDVRADGTMSGHAKEAHFKLIEWAMIQTSDSSTPDYGNDSCRFDITDRGFEHIKRLLKTALPVGRVVYTLPEDDPK